MGRVWRVTNQILKIWVVFPPALLSDDSATVKTDLTVNIFFTIVWGHLLDSEKYSQSMCRITIRTLRQNLAAIPFCRFSLALNTNLNVPMFYRQTNRKKWSKFSFCKLNQLVVSFNNTVSKLLPPLPSTKHFWNTLTRILGKVGKLFHQCRHSLLSSSRNLQRLVKNT